MWYGTEKIPAGDMSFFIDMLPYVSQYIEGIEKQEGGIGDPLRRGP